MRVEGAVNSPASVLYREGERLGYYIANAGGYARNADKGRVSVRYANGSARVKEQVPVLQFLAQAKARKHGAGAAGEAGGQDGHAWADRGHHADRGDGGDVGDRGAAKIVMRGGLGAACPKAPAQQYSVRARRSAIISTGSWAIPPTRISLPPFWPVGEESVMVAR